MSDDLAALARAQAVDQADPGQLQPRPFRDLTGQFRRRHRVRLTLQVAEQLSPAHDRTPPVRGRP